MLRENLMKEVGPGGVVPAVSSKEVTRLEEMIGDLQVAKQHTWEEKERLSSMYEEERKKNLANKVRCLTLHVAFVSEHVHTCVVMYDVCRFVQVFNLM